MYDIVCIGTGATGIYFGYKAFKANVKQKILFVSQDSQIGGRIHSFDGSGPNYKVETCAMRFYENQPLIQAAALELNIEITKIPAEDLPLVTPIHPEIEQELISAYPPIGNLYYDQSLQTAITLSSDAENVLQNANDTGYYYMLESMSLQSFYSEFVLSGLTELRFKNGFENFIKEMAKAVSTKYQIKLNYKVNTIEYNSLTKIYTINKEIQTKKIIYTGTLSSYTELVTAIPEIISQRQLALNLAVPCPGVKFFMYFDQPFWPSDALYKYTDHPLLNQFLFYSKNICQVYVIGYTADTLLNMLPAGLRNKFSHEYETLSWQNPSLFDKLLTYVKSQIPLILQSALPQYRLDAPTDSQLNSISQVMFQYRKQALATAKPLVVNTINAVDKIYSEVQIGKQNFFYLSGDVNKHGGGWVERCFEVVEELFDDVIGVEVGVEVESPTCTKLKYF
jgi:hypothetical protein